MEMTSLATVRATVGAAYLPGEGQCNLTPPSWFTGSPGDACRPGQTRQCNAVFSARVSVASTLSGTLLWDVSASNFQKFKPVGMHFFANLPGGAGVLAFADHTRGFIATALTHAGTNYLGSAVGMNLASYGVNQQQGLSVVDIPELEPGKQDVSLTVTNIDSGSTLNLFGFLYGYALR